MFRRDVAANDTYLGQLLQIDYERIAQGSCDNDETLNDIRNDLANAYASICLTIR